MGSKSRPGREVRKPKKDKKDKATKMPDLSDVMSGLPTDKVKSLKIKIKYKD